MRNYIPPFSSIGMRRLALSTLFVCTILVVASATLLMSAERTPKPLELVKGERWITHLEDDLIPYYLTPAAKGTPVGNFPTFRCDDGSQFDLCESCDGFTDLNTSDWAWIKEGIKRDYVRIKSRQVFFYCCAYHLTGREDLLILAREGLDYLQKTCFDEEGIPFSYMEGEGDSRSTGPPRLQRTSQDLAYALNGFVFYYYLTRDPKIEEVLIKVKNHIFDNYYDPTTDTIRWIVQDPEGTPSHYRESQRVELVAQLDQINAYMLLGSPCLSDEAEKKRWEKDMVHLSNVMIREFYNEEHGLFWGSIDSDDGRRIGSQHTDFGHTIKTLWMIERVGRLVDNQALLDFAVPKVPNVLAAAYLPDEETWASKPAPDGSIVRDKEWWIHCELDQAAATWAMHDSSFDRYLKPCNDFYFREFVDAKHGEVWHFLKADGSVDYPKAHLWKNGFHSSEHALVGYITSQELYDMPVELYFAPSVNAPQKGEEMDVRPYLYSGEVVDRTSSNFDDIKDLSRLKVHFTKIR